MYATESSYSRLFDREGLESVLEGVCENLYPASLAICLPGRGAEFYAYHCLQHILSLALSTALGGLLSLCSVLALVRHVVCWESCNVGQLSSWRGRKWCLELVSQNSRWDRFWVGLCYPGGLCASDADPVDAFK